jgi:hypothetical protein
MDLCVAGEQWNSKEKSRKESNEGKIVLGRL